MKYSELVEMQPKLLEFATTIPSLLDNRFQIVEYSAQQIILNKDEPITKIGILLLGSCRSICDHENGNIFVLQNQEPVSFIGAFACLGRGAVASAKFEATSYCKIAYIKRDIFEKWMESDAVFMRNLAVYYCSRFYNYFQKKGAERIYSSPSYLVLSYFIDTVKNQQSAGKTENYINKTREIIGQEIGLPIKTLNRTIKGLLDDGAITIQHRKIMLSKQQMLNSAAYLEKYKSIYKNGKKQSPEIQQRIG